MNRHTDQEKLLSNIAEMIHPILSIPEADRVEWFRAMEILTRANVTSGLLSSYRVGKLAGAWIRCAQEVWPSWPPQESSAGVELLSAEASGCTAGAGRAPAGPGQQRGVA
jgi:hypothetical protein